MSNNISGYLEKLFNDNYEDYKTIYAKIINDEQTINKNLSFDSFSQYFPSKYRNEAGNIDENTIFLSMKENEARYCLYNWYKYRVVYSVKNPDKTISAFSHLLVPKFFENIFFNSFCIEYDFNYEAKGCLVTIHDNMLYFAIVTNDKNIYSLFTYKIDIDSLDKVENIVTSDILKYEKINNVKRRNIIIKRDSEVISKVIKVLNAIQRGYDNLSDKLIQSIESVRSDKTLSYIHNTNIKVRKKQVILTDEKKIVTRYKYEHTPYIPTGSAKCPHPRRSYIRKYKRIDSNGNIYIKEVKVKSTIVHKEDYTTITEKVVK